MTNNREYAMQQIKMAEAKRREYESRPKISADLVSWNHNGPSMADLYADDTPTRGEREDMRRGYSVNSYGYRDR